MIEVGSKVRVVCFFHTYQGEIIGETEEDNRSVWIVLVKFPKLDIELEPVKSKFFKDSLNDIHVGITGYYIENTE